MKKRRRSVRHMDQDSLDSAQHKLAGHLSVPHTAMAEDQTWSCDSHCNVLSLQRAFEPPPPPSQAYQPPPPKTKKTSSEPLHAFLWFEIKVCGDDLGQFFLTLKNCWSVLGLSYCSSELFLQLRGNLTTPNKKRVRSDGVSGYVAR